MLGFNMRSYLATVVTGQMDSTENTNPGAHHAFAITFDRHANVYVAFQNTDVILRFKTNSFEPMAFPATLNSHDNIIKKNIYLNLFDVNNVSQVYPGTFAQFGLPGVITHNSKGLRSIVWVSYPKTSSLSTVSSLNITFQSSENDVNKYNAEPESDAVVGSADDVEFVLLNGLRDSAGTTASLRSNPKDLLKAAAVVEPQSSSSELMHELWVANENEDVVVILDEEARELGYIKISNPIHLFFDTTRSWVFIGSRSKKKNKGGAVYAVDVRTRAVVKKYFLLGNVNMNHPSGLAVYEDVLFVGEQEKNVVLAFNVTDERFLRRVFSSPRVKDVVEAILLSPC